MDHSWTNGQEELSSVDSEHEEIYVNGQNATKSNLYDERRLPVRTSSKSKPFFSTVTSVPDSLQVTLTPLVEGDSRIDEKGRGPRTAPRSTSDDSYRSGSSGSGPAPRLTSVHHRPSEASRLRVLSNGTFHSLPDGRHKQEASSPQESSWPRPPASKASEELSRPPLGSASTFPFQARDTAAVRQGPPVALRDRGRSTSSTRSAATISSMPLRPSTSIPDYSTAEPRYSRQRNFTSNANYRSGKAFTDNNLTGARREPNVKTIIYDTEEVRASVRSALTTTSSFLGTSGTERSSVLTKSSSATSIFGRDDGQEEGMSVDDAIGMYENGFADSGAEDDCASRPGTSFSHRSSNLRPPDLKNEFLGLPAPTFIVRDSTAMFQEPEGGFDSLDNADSFSRKITASHERQFIKRPLTNGSDSTASHSIKRPSSSPFGETRDRYGFRKSSQHVSLAQYESWNGPYSAYLTRRRKKWVALLKEASLPTENPIRFPPKSSKVKRFVRKGIPPDWRGAAWFYYAGGPAIVAKHSGLYSELIHKAASGQLSSIDQESIERDLNRTFPDNIRFKPDPQPNQGIMSSSNTSFPNTLEPETPVLKSLRRVLQAFSIYNPRIGYCQSLNFIAGLLLLFMDEEKSFWLLNVITREYLPGTHEVNLEGANVDLGVLMTSVKESMPTIWSKIGGELDGSAGSSQVSMRLPPITLCCSAWFMSCFIGTLPIETTLRVWDSFFYEGSKTLFRISLAIFKVGEAEIKAVNDPMEIFQVVQTIPRRLIDASALMEACFKRRNGFGHLSQETIDARRVERRKGYADERARVAGGLPEEATVQRKGTIFSRRRGKGRGGDIL